MRAVLAAASLLLLSGVLLGVGQARPTGPCDGFEDVPGQGPSRRAAGGLWEVCLQDGSTVLTHGGDPHGLDRAHAPDGPLHAAGEDAAASGPVEGTDGEAGAAGAAAAPSGGSSGYAAPRAPPCAADPLLQHHMVAVYAYASNRQDRYNSKADTVRGYVHQANGHMHAEAQQHGFGVEYRFLCDAGGQVAVLRLALSTPSSQVTFSSVMSDAIAAGMRDPRAQYWIWYDGSDPNYCGIGQFNGDMSLYTGNANNRGQRYGLTFGCGWTTMMHENAHNLGAVQYGAPHSSGAAHCNDGTDIMCYADGGPNSAMFTACSGSKERWDCNSDTYFHPDPPAGSWLSYRWNLGSPLNRFITHSAVTAVPGPVQGLKVDDGHIAGGVTLPRTSKWLTWQPPATGNPVTEYVLYRADPGQPELLHVRLNGEATSFTDNWATMKHSGAYTYRLVAVNAAGVGASATVVAQNTYVA